MCRDRWPSVKTACPEQPPGKGPVSSDVLPSSLLWGEAPATSVTTLSGGAQMPYWSGPASWFRGLTWLCKCQPVSTTYQHHAWSKPVVPLSNHFRGPVDNWMPTLFSSVGIGPYFLHSISIEVLSGLFRCMQWLTSSGNLAHHPLLAGTTIRPSGTCRHGCNW